MSEKPTDSLQLLSNQLDDLDAPIALQRAKALGIKADTIVELTSILADTTRTQPNAGNDPPEPHARRGRLGGIRRPEFHSLSPYLTVLPRSLLLSAYEALEKTSIPDGADRAGFLLEELPPYLAKQRAYFALQREWNSQHRRRLGAVWTFVKFANHPLNDAHHPFVAAEITIAKKDRASCSTQALFSNDNCIIRLRVMDVLSGEELKAFNLVCKEIIDAPENVNVTPPLKEKLFYESEAEYGFTPDALSHRFQLLAARNPQQYDGWDASERSKANNPIQFSGNTLGLLRGGRDFIKGIEKEIPGKAGEAAIAGVDFDDELEQFIRCDLIRFLQADEVSASRVSDSSCLYDASGSVHAWSNPFRGASRHN